MSHLEVCKKRWSQFSNVENLAYNILPAVGWVDPFGNFFCKILTDLWTPKIKNTFISRIIKSHRHRVLGENRLQWHSLYIMTYPGRYKIVRHICHWFLRSISGECGRHRRPLCRQVGDGHRLRLWRASVEVEAPPQEVLQLLLRQRHLVDPRLQRCSVLARLADDAEVLQYWQTAPPPLPSVHFCVLSAWRADLPRGACAVIQTSVHHPGNCLSGLRPMARWLPCLVLIGATAILHIFVQSSR